MTNDIDALKVFFPRVKPKYAELIQAIRLATGYHMNMERFGHRDTKTARRNYAKNWS